MSRSKRPSNSLLLSATKSFVGTFFLLGTALSCRGVIGIDELPRGAQPTDANDETSVVPPQDAEAGPSTFCSKTQIEGPQHKYCADFDESVETVWAGAAKLVTGLESAQSGGASISIEPADGSSELVVSTTQSAPGVGSGGHVELKVDRSLSTTLDVSADVTLDSEANAFILLLTLIFPPNSANTGAPVYEEWIRVWADKESIGMSIHHRGATEPSEPVRFAVPAGRKRVRLKREADRFRLFIDGRELGSKSYPAVSSASAVVSLRLGAGFRDTDGVGSAEVHFDNLTVD